jgi:DNA repair protein RecO (recombination protein O)
MSLVSDSSICLRKFEYSETSQILTLFSKNHGIVRAIAKGAHRQTKAGASRFDGGVDVLDFGNALFTADTSRDLAILAEWKLREGHLEMRRSLRAMYLGLYSAELVSMLIEERDPHPELFERLRATLAELSTPRIEESFLSLQLDLLRESGYLPELGSCVACEGSIHAREPAYFSAARSGIICRSCEAGIPDRVGVDLRLLRLLQGLMRLPRSNGSPQRLPRLTRHQTDPLNRLLADHVEYTIGKRIRLRRYVVGVRRPAPAGAL